MWSCDFSCNALPGRAARGMNMTILEPGAAVGGFNQEYYGPKGYQNARIYLLE